MAPPDSFAIGFAPEWTAQAVVVPPDLAGDDLLGRMGLAAGATVVALTGSTAAGSADDGPMADAIAGGLGPAALDNGWHLVTGGTDAGIFTLLGRSAEAAGAVSAPWVGIAPLDLVTWPGRPPGPADVDREPLEPHHSHFALVRGGTWGDETSTQVALVGALARGGTGLVVVAGGGGIARKEVLGHARAGNAMLVLAGTGRLADEMAAAVAGRASTDAELALVAGSGRVTVCDVAGGARAVTAAVLAAMPARQR